MSEIREVDVIKVGSSTLSRPNADGTYELDRESFQRIGSQVLARQEAGSSVVIVSSAAITAGMAKTGLTERPAKSEMPQLQRLASIGWRGVLNEWERALPGTHIGEMLLSRHELGMTSERDEALKTMHALLSHGDIPVINENDSVTHEEISYGDNDTLAGEIARSVNDSDIFGGIPVRLMMLSDVNGFYADINTPTTFIPRIAYHSIRWHIPQAGGAGSENGTGGMRSKMLAAEAAGPHVVSWVTNGRAEDTIQRTLAGQIGTQIINVELLGQRVG